MRTAPSQAGRTRRADTGAHAVEHNAAGGRHATGQDDDVGLNGVDDVRDAGREAIARPVDDGDGVRFTAGRGVERLARGAATITTRDGGGGRVLLDASVLAASALRSVGVDGDVAERRRRRRLRRSTGRRRSRARRRHRFRA